MEKKIKKQDFITTELAKYNLPDATIAGLKKKYITCKVADPKDIDNYMFAKSGHQEVKALRSAVERKRVELKSSSLDFGRKVDGEAKRLTGMLKEVEDHLMTQRKVVEDEKARLIKEKEEADRKEKERIQREEEERLEKIRLEQEAKEKELQDKQDKIDADNRKIEEDKEANRRESARLEQEKKDAEKAKQDEIDRKEREKQHAKEVEQAKQDAAEQAKKDEQERVAKEKADQAEKERQEKAEEKRQETLKPDREKLKDLADSLINFSYPACASKEAQAVTAIVNQQLNTIAVQIKKAKL